MQNITARLQRLPFSRFHQTYVMAHAYTAKAIERIVRIGVRTIEHGNLIDDQAAAVMAEFNAYAVPTNVVYDAMSKVGRESGVPEPALIKNEVVRKQGLEALKILKKKWGKNRIRD